MAALVAAVLALLVLARRRSVAKVTFPLRELSSSGQGGTANLTDKGSMTQVNLSIPRGALATELAHIHSGQCGETLGGVVFPLTSFVGGSGLSTTVVGAPLYRLMDGFHAINLHQRGNTNRFTACGNIPLRTSLPPPCLAPDGLGYGDLNGDGVIDGTDVELMIRLVGTTVDPLNPVHVRADLQAIGGITIAEIYSLQDYIDGRVISFVVCPHPVPAIPPCLAPDGIGYGDLNGDGVIDEADVAILKALFGPVAPSNPVHVRADLDGDGVITRFDQAYLGYYIAGIIESFPVCGSKPYFVPAFLLPSVMR